MIISKRSATIRVVTNETVILKISQPTANQERSSKSYVHTYVLTYIRISIYVYTYLYVYMYIIYTYIRCVPLLQQRPFVRRKNNIERTNLKQMYEMLA